MDAIRVPKVERVTCVKGSQSSVGTLHLTAHHLIFRVNGEENSNEEEMWVPYPLIALVTRLPLTLEGQCPLTLRQRTFEAFTLVFDSEGDAIDVFDSVKELTVATSITQLYAFFYTPNPPFVANDGWTLYSPREEFGRMGIGSRTKAWRFTDINKDYSFCPTYPARLVIPTKISDTTLQYASKYRSKCRIPALVYLHWANFGTITRSSQPMVGITQNRSVQDEKLIEAIFQSHHSPESRVSAGPIYGATATNLIIDARPTTNAVANTAKGAGTENMDHYKEAKKAYLGVDNIHVMRDSLSKVVDALSGGGGSGSAALATSPGSGGVVPEQEVETEVSSSLVDRQGLRRSGWLKHISAILEGTLLIVRNVHVNSSHVLIHCSDGWDRTAQLSSLSQLCLDPYYRTLRGFQVLVEKDWLSFGHKFLDRCGHLSSEKFFLAPVENAGGGGSAEAAQAFFASVQNRFTSQSHLKETSPVFHQFLECVRQIQRQFPERFEFNERLLRQLHYHLYSCQFGNFLYNCERERRFGEAGQPPASERTKSVWDFLNSPAEMELNSNKEYDRSLDDPASREAKADMGVLFPNVKDVRFWHELYGRTDEEMNGRIVIAQAQGADTVGPVEDAAEDPVMRAMTPSMVPLPASPAKMESRSVTPMRAGTDDPEAAFTSKSEITTPMNRGSTMTDHGFRPFPESSTVSALRPTETSPYRASSPGASVRKPSAAPDLFGSGVKSLWGNFSSKASAAFTAAQGAYEGVARDFKGFSATNAPGSSSRELLEQGGELQHPTQWNALDGNHEGADPAWSASAPAGSASGASSLSAPAGNPWGATPGVRIPSMMLDNPWNSVRSPTSSAPAPPSPRARAALNDLSLFDPPDKSLPPDPTVAHPGPLSQTEPAPAPPEPAPAAPRPPPADTDPLGVGGW